MNKLILLKIEDLVPHPRNPRKNLGDLAELTESIKKNGVMQNLTVVPWVSEMTGNTEKGKYTVIIGHRRMAAAKAAGLCELPCIIKELTPAEQMAMMLAENMQRNSLTPVEQAEGVQMMLDLGETVKEISDKTGFSESTVRRRIKLLELDIERLRASEKRGATLEDYEKLFKLEDRKARNSLIDKIGTNNFNMELENAVRAEEFKKKKEKMLEALKSFAEKVKKRPENTSSYIYYNFTSGNVEIPSDKDKVKYYYEEYSYGVQLYKEKEDELPEGNVRETEDERHERELIRLNNERKDKLSELAKAAYNLRKQFVIGFNPAPKHSKDIKRFLWDMLCFSGEGVYREELSELTGLNLTEGGSFEEMSEMVSEYFSGSPEKCVLIAAYSICGDTERGYIDFNKNYSEEPVIDKLYENLERLGYLMSDDEIKLQNGTHELFKEIEA